MTQIKEPRDFCVRIKIAPLILIARKRHELNSGFLERSRRPACNLLVVALATVRAGRRKLLLMQKASLVAMEDSVIAVKKVAGTIKLSQLAALWGIRAAGSSNPASAGAGALTDFGTND